MRILSVVTSNYYGHANSIEPMYVAFTEPLARLGHTVETFDHAMLMSKAGQLACGERFVKAVERGGYDLVLYQTGGRDHMVRDAISHASRITPTVAWNSDDDWQWESYCRHIAPCFTYMVTTYPHVFEKNRAEFPNLRLSQWGCFERLGKLDQPKDLEFTFAGQIYRNRVQEMRYLRRKAKLEIRGLGSLRVWCRPFNNRRFREIAAKVFPACNRPLPFNEVYAIWNRSKISYTPLAASVDPKVLQIKGRIFEMGMTGTVMLCNDTPALHRYYEPGREYVAFGDLDDCIAKAKYLLGHEALRQRIAQAYYRRTKAEHLWEHRWQQLFKEIGVSGASRVAA
jgi:spore maturation protein CgeB